MRRAAYVGWVVLALGCASEERGWDDRFDAIRAQADRSAVAIDVPHVDLAAAHGAHEGQTRLLITADAVTLDASPTATRTFPANGSEAERTRALPPAPQIVCRVDPTLPELAMAPTTLDRARLDDVEIVADRTLDAALVLRALDAATRTYGLTHAALRVTSRGAPAAIAIDLVAHTAHGGRAVVDTPPEGADGYDAVMLEAFVRPRGITVSASGGTLAAGCGAVVAADVVTIADDGTIDADAVHACVRRIHAELPDAAAIYVVADEGVSLERFATFLAALGGTDASGMTSLRPLERRVERPPVEREVLDEPRIEAPLPDVLGIAAAS